VPETFEDLMEAAKKLHDPAHDLYGGNFGYHIRLINMYIWPSIFRAYGGEWFDKAGNPTINSKQSIDATSYYVEFLTKYGPPGVASWNWPESLDAFVTGRLAQTFMGSASVPVAANPAKSQVVGKFGVGRWPKGPAGKRVTSVWNWSFPINKAISPKARKATWLWTQWMASKPMQIQTSYGYRGKEESRSGVNRMSIWSDERYRRTVAFAPGFADTVLTSIREDTDIDWRPRVPQWPELANILGIQLHRALAKQATPQEALDEANVKIAELMKQR
jgi:ABC-type glycerol-3-phosphate transport system substrate-binding protein